MRKITFFICSLSSGGAEHQLSELANFLFEKGYNIEIVTFSNRTDHYELFSAIKRINILGKGRLYTFLKLFWFILNHKTDCFISFCQRSNFIVLLPLVFRPRIKVICGERNLSLDGGKDYIQEILFRFLYNRANYIVPNSFSQKKFILKRVPKFSGKTITITNYTDLSLYRYSELNNNSLLRFAIFCRYEAQKNCLRFLDAVAEVKKKSNVSFVIEWFGNQNFPNDSLKQYFTKVKKKILDNNLEDVVILNDAIRNVPDKLPEFDAVILPSLFEGFSNSISEAICCGKPLLVSDVSDNSIMVHDGENGFLFDPQNIESISMAILKYFDLTVDERAIMGKNSRIIAEKLFNKEKFLQSYIQLIEN